MDTKPNETSSLVSMNSSNQRLILSAPTIASDSPDILSSPAPETSHLVKRFKKRYPILFAILVIVSFCVGAGLSGSLTSLIKNHLFKDD